MNDYQKIKTDLKAHIVHTEPVWKRMIKWLRKSKRSIITFKVIMAFA